MYNLVEFSNPSLDDFALRTDLRKMQERLEMMGLEHKKQENERVRTQETTISDNYS